MIPGRRLVPLAFLLLCTLTSFSLTGCTAIGFGVGALVDMSNGKRAPDNLGPIRTGTDVTVWLRDGRKLDGQYMGRRDALSRDSTATPASSGDSTVAPARPSLLLATNNGTRQIAIEDVKRVSVPVARGKVFGLVHGATIDVLLILLFLAALSQVDLS